MASIPASQLVNVVPSVLTAGSSALDFNGLFLTTSWRVPIGTVPSFPTADEVGDYFGPSSVEKAAADVYFSGFEHCTVLPDELLFAQYPQDWLGVKPYLRGGNISAITLDALRTYSGVLTVEINGEDRTSDNIDLSSATSFSNAASIIQAAFPTAEAYDAVVTGSIAAGTATSVTGSITGNVLTVTAVGAGALVVGGLLAGTGGGGVAAGTFIMEQLTGTTGGVGTYRVSEVQSVASSAITQTYGLLTITAVSGGTVSPGQAVTGTGGAVAADTRVAALVSGTGGTGTYVLTGGSQTVSSRTLTLGGLTVTYDSVSGAFLMYGGTPDVGTIGFGEGSIATQLLLTEATGAVLSQGAPEGVPADFMDAVTAVATNWVTFTTLFNPDAYGNEQRQAFQAWNNGENDRYAYVPWDSDVTPTTSNNAPASLGRILKDTASSGAIVVWAPNDDDGISLAAFVCGMAASIDWNAVGGRITLAFKTQSGLPLTVTDATVAQDLLANGYNFHGRYAAANQMFEFFQNGGVSGPFKWADSYLDQIWLNNELQLALLDLLALVNSIPYTPTGYAMVENAIGAVAVQGVSNGVISQGVELSAAQRIAVNTAAGAPIADILQARGWYAQVQRASAQVRGARTSPPCKFWYTDGGSIQQIELASIEIQ